MYLHRCREVNVHVPVQTRAVSQIGLGYQGTDEKGNHKWHGVTNCYSLSVETATTMPAITNNWNLGVNTWLKHYVYLRIPDVFQSRGANNNLKNVITKSLAAFWHGFYPGM